MYRGRAGEKGMTLLEVAVVLLVVGLIVAMGIRLQRNGLEASAASVQRARLYQASQALVQYALNEYRLPCPNVPMAGDVPTGVETKNSDGSCRASVGWLPYVALGLQVPNGQNVNTWMRYGVYVGLTRVNTASALQAAVSNALSISPNQSNPYVATDASCQAVQLNPAFALALGAANVPQDPTSLCFVAGRGVAALQVRVESLTDLLTQVRQIRIEKTM